MPDQVRVEVTCPTNAAFEKSELKGRKPTRNAAQKQPFGNCLSGNGKVPDVIEDEIGRRGAKSRAARARMKRRHHSKLDALRPHRVIIVWAVNAEDVRPGRQPSEL